MPLIAKTDPAIHAAPKLRLSILLTPAILSTAFIVCSAILCAVPTSIPAKEAIVMSLSVNGKTPGEKPGFPGFLQGRTMFMPLSQGQIKIVHPPFILKRGSHTRKDGLPISGKQILGFEDSKSANQCSLPQDGITLCVSGSMVIDLPF